MPTLSSSSPVTVGIDVGGLKKGFHAVALRDGRFHAKITSRDAAEIANWCRDLGAVCIGIDAPCHWRGPEKARAAEVALMRAGIHCFSTPTKEMAESHPSGFFHWMVNGASMFAHLDLSHPLFKGSETPLPTSFETFPQAIACALAGKRLSAQDKRRERRQLLESAGVCTQKLGNIDWLDAGLCALTAYRLTYGRWQAYGDLETGFIVVPR